MGFPTHFHSSHRSDDDVEMGYDREVSNSGSESSGSWGTKEEGPQGNNRFRGIAGNANSFASQVSENEMKDQVCELTSLVANTGGRVSPLYSLYGGVRENESVSRRPFTLPRTMSDDSIATVSALPDMTIRSHSIQFANGQHGGCTIRYSTTKLALRAAQQEKRAFKSSLQNPEQQLDQQPFDTEYLSHNLKECYWIDIETIQRSTDELYAFLKQLRLPKHFASILSEPINWTSDVTALKFVLLAIFQILPINTDSDEITHVALLSMPRLLVTFSTFQTTETSSFGKLYHLVFQHMRCRERIPQPTNTGILLAWLHFHVQRTSRAIRELRTKTLEMDEVLDQDFANFSFDAYVQVKNCLLRVLSVAEEQHYTIEALAGAEGGTKGLDFSQCQCSLSVLRATAASNERQSARIDKHLKELRERIMAERENTLNRRLSLLTILSAIFMPLTLLSGIWGMNFDNMPELGVEGAYQKALLGMLLLSLCMLCSFHRAGWTD